MGHVITEQHKGLFSIISPFQSFYFLTIPLKCAYICSLKTWCQLVTPAISFSRKTCSADLIALHGPASRNQLYDMWCQYKNDPTFCSIFARSLFYLQWTGSSKGVSGLRDFLVNIFLTRETLFYFSTNPSQIDLIRVMLKSYCFEIIVWELILSHVSICIIRHASFVFQGALKTFIIWNWRCCLNILYWGLFLNVTSFTSA